MLSALTGGTRVNVLLHSVVFGEVKRGQTGFTRKWINRSTVSSMVNTNSLVLEDLSSTLKDGAS